MPVFVEINRFVQPVIDFEEGVSLELFNRDPADKLTEGPTKSKVENFHLETTIRGSHTQCFLNLYIMLSFTKFCFFPRVNRKCSC